MGKNIDDIRRERDNVIRCVEDCLASLGDDEYITPRGVIERYDLDFKWHFYIEEMLRKHWGWDYHPKK